MSEHTIKRRGATLRKHGEIRITIDPAEATAPLTVEMLEPGLLHMDWGDRTMRSFHVEQLQDGEWRTISRITRI